jgi:16S rRNA (uracil1498-N3)-methyltransferase
VDDAAPAWAAAWPATAHVFLDDLADDARVDGDDGHHLARVRRVRAGETVTGADGRGTWRPYDVRAVTRDELVLGAAGPARLEPAPTPSIEVAFALTKGAKPETVVQQLTELGVDRIRPFWARRSVVRWDAARADAAVARLHRVAREAAMQCRRARLPGVEPPAAFADVAGLASGAVDGSGLTSRPTLVLGDPGGIGADALARSPEPHSSGQAWLAVVGPEGGLDPDEIAGLGPVVRLAVGHHVLRAETAAVAVAAVLVARRGSAHAG